MFEAGALTKSLTVARVCPLLFGVEPSDIKGPLVQFHMGTRYHEHRTLSSAPQGFRPP